MEKKEMLQLNGISKKFGQNVALKDISISLKEGEILGFLGPSGSGKTTTIKIITGQLRQTAGKAFVLGKDSREIDESIYEQIGIVTDTSGFYEKMTVYQNLTLFAKILKVDLKRVDELLDRVGLTKQKKQLASKLSKGQGQRLVLARAILHNPKILFLDEPTSGLDPSTALEIHKLLLELKSKGMAIFLTTHNMEEATKLCDIVSLLNDGNIVEIGSPQELCLRYNKKKQYRILRSNQEEVILPQTPETANQIKEWMEKDEIETIHSCEPTLESVFLTVTGRRLQ